MIATAVQPPLHHDFAVSSQRSVLASIGDATLSFAIWRRSLAPDITAEVAAWIENAKLELDLLVAADEPVRVALAAVPVGVGIVDDIERLFAEFCSLSRAPRVRLALSVKRGDACRKFHTDNVRLRLITTYFGPGTEWVPNYAVDRAALADPPLCPREANRKIVRDRRAVRHAHAGDVLLLKGARGSSERAAVHRSPPIAARGLVRLVLTLTTAE